MTLIICRVKGGRAIAMIWKKNNNKIYIYVRPTEYQSDVAEWDELNSAKDFKTNLSKSYFLQDKPKVCMPMKSGKMLARLQLLQLVYQPILLKRTWSFLII